MRLDGAKAQQPSAPLQNDFVEPSTSAASQPSNSASTPQSTTTREQEEQPGIKPTDNRVVAQPSAVQATPVAPAHAVIDQARSVGDAAPEHGEGQGQAQLPQTGNDRSFLGLTLGILTGSLSLFGLRKRRF